MAGVSSTRGAKRKMADPPPEALKVTLLSSSVLLLDVPTDTNTSLPAWEALRSRHVDVTWTVRPYSIGVHFTPATSKRGKASASKGRSADAVGHTSAPCVLLTFPQGGTQPAMTDSVSLPLLLTQPQPARQLSRVPLIPTLATTPTNFQAASKGPAPSPFHTKFSSEVKICDHFLLNMCFEGQECHKHHTPYPFHWQLWSLTNHQWVDISPRSQVLLERMYCNVSHDVIGIRDGNRRYTFNCDAMEMDDSSNYDAIRRLENSGDEFENCYFPSKWKIYWWSNISWEEYDKNMSASLLKKMREKVSECFFHVGEQQYKLDFTRMVQINVNTGFERGVRCRPMYRSPDSMQPHLQTGTIDPTEATSDPPGANFSVDPLGEFSSWYPPVWRLPSEEDYSLVEVPAGTLAYRRVQNLFYETMPETSVNIVSIQQIQNLLHWDQYQRQKVYMQKQKPRPKEPLERHLFHGTSKEASVDICHNNFDARMAGLNGRSHGSGSYFATTSSYSNTFSVNTGPDEVRHMFLAKVLVGKVCIGRCNYQRPPPILSRKKQFLLYDACVDNMDKPTMFVVFDSCQCYPYYLIKYKDLPQEIDI